MSEKPKVLLVDDELSIIKMVGKRLEAEGFEVTTATDGEDGLQKAKTGSPDVVVLDLMLPKMDGYKVCGLLKKDSRYAKIPIILFSARAQEKDIQLGQEVGADAYIPKPFTAPTLIGKIRELLQKVQTKVE